MITFSKNQFTLLQIKVARLNVGLTYLYINTLKIAKESGNEQCIVVSGLSSKESLAIQRMSIAANNQRNLRNCLLQIDKIYHYFCQCRMYRKNVYYYMYLVFLEFRKYPPIMYLKYVQCK